MPLLSTSQRQHRFLYSRSQRRVAEYDDIITCSSHLDEFVIPRLWDTRLLNVVESVHNRAKSISQSGTSGMARESCPIDLVVNPIGLDILTIPASILLRGMTSYPSLPDILRPNTRLHVWKFCKTDIVEVGSSRNHSIYNSLNLCFEHVRLCSFD